MQNKKTNLNKLSAILIFLLIAASISTVVAGNGAGQEQQIGQTNQNTSMQDANQVQNSEAPDISENAKRYNNPDVTPNGETHQVRAQEQTVFEYRNMTMVMNCTQNCDVTFTADQEVAPKIFGLNVDPNQTMTLAMNLTKSPLNGAMVNERNLNFYLGIEPEATLQLQAQIRLYIDQAELNQNMNREVNASRLTWMYWNQTQAQWQSVESYMDQNGYLVCNTDHFSTWTVVEQAVEEDQNTAQNSGLQIEFVAVAVIIAVAVAALGIFAYKKHK